MSMNRKTVQMLVTDGSRGKGEFYLLPNAEADALVARGAAKLPDAPKVVGPTETKPMAPVLVKAPVK